MQQPTQGLAGLREQEYQPSIAQSNVRSVVSHSSFDNLLKQFKEYVPRSSMLNLQSLKSSSNLKLKKFKESAYYGQMINNRRHGQGVMIYNNERVYQGHWENDYKHGTGYEVFPNGAVYQGAFLNGKPQGVGRYDWPNGEFFQGEWLNGLKHGSGMWQGAKGDSYVGQWRMGKADGYGVHVWVNGDRYEGQFKNCLKHGQGTQKFANGDLYKGEYTKGKPNGYGEYYWSNGSYFKGNFQQGLRQGHGMWKKGLGASDKYEGQYASDKKHGYGIFSWSSGNIYKGNYQYDLRTGYGEMYWKDGSYYKGQWEKGIQHGEGVLFVPGQGSKRGVFKDNILVELIEEQVMFTPPQPQPSLMPHPPPPRPGTIQKNQNSINNSNQVPLLQASRSNYRSMDNKRKVLSVYDHPQKVTNSRVYRELHPISHKADKKLHNKTTHIGEAERVHTNTNVGNMRSRERIPHSAFYMHKLHKRVSTAHNEQKSSIYPKKKEQINDQLRNFTKKMVGKKQY